MTAAVPDAAERPGRRPVTLAERLSHTGDLLFRWRSYLPLALSFPAGSIAATPT